MDRRERAADLNIALLAAIEGERATVWTAMPCIVQSYDAAKGTCSVQPAIKALVRDQAGTESWVSLPLLVDCPVIFPGGGGYVLTFPITAGDECLVIFASRCIDAWWQSGGVQIQADIRMHDLSDGFVIVGPRSQARPISSPSTTDVVLRNAADTTSVSLSPNGDLTLKSPTKLAINAPSVMINGLELIGHRHSGVDTGGGISGPQV